ncbi:hypothetical protein D9623_33550 (plasmid) [Azospirillum brasilense]|uniref:Putative tail fiber protein gp53-like C-terminal domain-containing protein n=1 Tax=Azospirillum brasilense TaxID=192 RepID=A0A4D8QTH3_AZOBR|nr:MULTISPECIES: hypothetical protein [Azospirillum]YP_001686891.1 virion structural protein [Azospirillum phage Cd]MDW7555366.1 hypothetical protein [Azospirillum brasilense]MDW7595226.1 hypothetical protein [Azospirillum brasilense]MDW7630380.1 hypothetical protein [Azospirillum brasilense]MDX5949747.1 hypothetical protein [Azospirillum brasilense]OPH16878.1 hypothetical protein FE89_02660 [Azospirillum brasilense]
MLYDRVEQTTITTGTGTLSLVAPSDASRRSFVQAAGSGTQVFYCIETIDGTQYEYGIGTCTAGSPDTLTRTTVLLSSNSNALVNFPSGTKRVFSTLPASRSGVTSRSLSPNGYQMLPGGALLQWGTGNAGPGGPSITFPVAFPVACLSVTAGTANGASYGGYISVDNNLVTRTGFVAYASGGAVTSNFFAIGY